MGCILFGFKEKPREKQNWELVFRNSIWFMVFADLEHPVTSFVF